MKKFKTLIVFVLLVTIVVSTACGRNNKQADGSKETKLTNIDTLTVGTMMEFKSPSRTDYNTGVISYGLVQTKLITRDEQGNIQPALATKWSTDDAKLWKFEMRDDMYWHDGVKVTPEDIKFSVEYLKKQTPQMKSVLKDFETVKVTGPTSFEMQLSKPNSRIMDSFISFVPKHIFEKVDNYETYTGDGALLGNGPYKITKHDSTNGIIELETVDNFYMGKNITVKKIVYKTYKNWDTMQLALKSGEIDMIYDYAKGINNTAVDDFEKDPNITLKRVNNTGLPAMIYFNIQAEPVNQVAVRKAVAVAVDYEKIAKLFGSKYASAPEKGILPKGTIGYKDMGKYKQDLNEVENLLKTAGYEKKDGFYTKNGKKLEIEIVSNSTNELRSRVVEVIKTDLEKIGISVSVKNVDSATFSTIADADHTHVALMGGATPAGMATGAGAGTAYYDSRFYGWSMVSDPTFQKLVDEMYGAKTDDEYKALVEQAQKYYVENIPAIPLYNDEMILAYSSKLEGFKYDFNYGLLNAHSAYSLKKKQ